MFSLIPLNDNKVYYQNMIFIKKIVITNFHDKLRNLSFIFFVEIHIKDILKSLETGQFWYIKVIFYDEINTFLFLVSFKFSNPDSSGVKKAS